MTGIDMAMLAGLAASASVRPNGQLDAEAVNGLGTALGLDGPAVLAAVTAMQKEQLVEIAWGPLLSVTGKGRRRVAGQPEPDAGVVLGAGATYIRGSVGKKAKVAINSTVKGIPASVLTAALALLQQTLPTLPDAARGPAESLHRELSDAQTDTGNQKTDGAGLLKRLTEGVEILSQAEKAGGMVSHLADMLKSLFDSLS
ncbi:hypothetical protein [Nitrospirillum pindoramense]|uniref:Uncharacterized protein n=1 Tax=Nitrospirillum amazonense TaxID=28077 RepID=A0A560GHJ2_9PROT|nr:hypothetical protein [Nitrospirillum amazonense]TWB33100.1 hypothetical protein FBZ90_1363 [Nitrospirillum amazonense]